MRKWFLFSVLALGFLWIGCNSSDDRDEDRDTYSVIYDIVESFYQQPSGGVHVISKNFNRPIPSSDVVLIYRRQAVDGGNNVWRLIPKTLYLDEGELDYSFDFTRNDINIYASGNFNLTNQSNEWKNTYLNNQMFRVVIVPASAGRYEIDFSDYDAVIKHYHIDDSRVPKF